MGSVHYLFSTDPLDTTTMVSKPKLVQPTDLELKNEASQDVPVSFETRFSQEGFPGPWQKLPRTDAWRNPRMTCWSPLKGFLGPGGTFVASRNKAPGGMHAIPKTVPCGQCTGCRLDRSREWSVRIAHEASLYEHNCFVTLTYDDDHLPAGGNLVKPDFQKFMKRLRKLLAPQKVRYFACGEYGEDNLRPHYHAIIFNWRPADAYVWRMARKLPIWRSETLERLWSIDGVPIGFCEFGSVTAQSGGYVARYVLKKSTTNHDGRYDRVDPETGEVWTVDPEFMVCSTVPMLGYDWFKKYEGDCFPSGYLLVDGKKVPIPKAYVKKMTRVDPHPVWNTTENERIMRRKAVKLAHDPQRKANSTDERLAVRGEVQRLRVERLKREL